MPEEYSEPAWVQASDHHHAVTQPHITANKFFICFGQQFPINGAYNSDHRFRLSFDLATSMGAEKVFEDGHRFFLHARLCLFLGSARSIVMIAAWFVCGPRRGERIWYFCGNGQSIRGDTNYTGGTWHFQRRPKLNRWQIGSAICDKTGFCWVTVVLIWQGVCPAKPGIRSRALFSIPRRAPTFVMICDISS